MWIDKSRGFYNRWKNSCLQGNAHNEGKSIVAETFTTTFKNKIYKCMTSLPKTVYIDKLDDIINEYNNTYHTAIEIILMV